MVPALVFVTVAGSVSIAALVLLSRGAGGAEDEGGIGMPAPDVRQIGAGGVAEITLKDRDDPDRVVAVISYDSQTPAGLGRYDTVRPRAWVHLQDGSYLHIRADEGRFYAPDEQRPQSGVMRGDVVVRLFDPAAVRPSVDAEAPVVARLESLSFDTEYGELRTDQRVVIVTPEVEFVSNDLRIVLNQVQERIERLDVRRGERITYTPRGREAAGGVGDAAAGGAEDAGAEGGPSEGVVAAAASDVGAGRDAESAAASAGGSGVAGTNPGRPAPRGVAGRGGPVEPPVFYFAQFREGVRLAQADVTATGDSLEVWARVVENALAEGPIGGVAVGAREGSAPMAMALREALASVAMASMEGAWPPRLRRGELEGAGGNGAGGTGAGEGERVAAEGAEPAEPEDPVGGARELVVTRTLATPSADVPMTLEWTGALTLRPLAAEPSELRREHLAARLTGGEGGGVNMADASSGAAGTCARLEYGFTTRGVVFAGVGESGTRLSSGAASESERAGGTLRSGRTEYSLATGIGRVPGPGSLVGAGLERIAWTAQMDFVLRSIGERVVASLEEVMFHGDVRGEDESTSFEAGFARAEFVPGEGEESVLSAITLEDAVRLRGRAEERVTAGMVRVEFAAGGPEAGGDPEPVWFGADGGVVAVRPGERVAAEHLEASLSPGADGRPEVRTLSGSGGVDLRSRPRGVEIVGDDLEADVPAQRLAVRGSPERPARVIRGQTGISGMDVRLAGEPRSVDVFGMGTFSHAAEGAAGAGAGSARVAFDAAWTRAMRFDDVTGALRCEGDVVATMVEGSAREDRLKAGTVDVTIDAAPEAEESGGAAGGGEVEGGVPDDGRSPLLGSGLGAPGSENRRLLTLVATGTRAESPEGAPATIESRRYGPPAADGSRVLWQLLYLEGARILVDNVVGTVDVPGEGKLVVVDRRTPESERPTEGTPLSGGTARGDALFDWAGSLRVERGPGVMTMTERVRMTHRRAGDNMVTSLEAPVLTARSSGGEEDGAGRLRSVHAEGGVWVRSGEIEVTADVVDYDADTGILHAFNRFGSMVRVMQGASVTTYEAIRWDLPAERIEIANPGGLVSPR